MTIDRGTCPASLTVAAWMGRKSLEAAVRPGCAAAGVGAESWAARVFGRILPSSGAEAGGAAASVGAESAIELTASETAADVADLALLSLLAF